MEQEIKINKSDLLSAIYETDFPIEDKDNFYIIQVYKRLEYCSSTYFSSFDEELDKILSSLEKSCYDSKSIKRLARLSKRVISSAYDNYLDALKRYLKE